MCVQVILDMCAHARLRACSCACVPVASVCFCHAPTPCTPALHSPSSLITRISTPPSPLPQAHLPILQVGKVFFVHYAAGDLTNSISAAEQARLISGDCLPHWFVLHKALVRVATLSGTDLRAALRSFTVAFGEHWLMFFAEALTADPTSTAAKWHIANDSFTGLCGAGSFDDVLEKVRTATAQGKGGVVRMRVVSSQYEIVGDISLEARRSVAMPGFIAAQRQLVKAPPPRAYTVSGLTPPVCPSCGLFCKPNWGKQLQMVLCFLLANVLAFDLPGVQLDRCAQGWVAKCCVWK